MYALKLSPTEEGAKKQKWTLSVSDDVQNKTVKLCDLDLIASSLTNKFETVAALFDDMSKLIPNDFVPWYTNMIKEYIKSNYNSELILQEVPNFLNVAYKYIDAKNINFDSFVNKDKASKTSIVFLVDDIKALAAASVCLKLYSAICYDEKMKLTDNIHKLVYAGFIKPCYELGTTTKIYQTMRSRTYRSSITDRYMWELIKMMIVETPESYTLLMFNFLLTNLLATLDITTNPIPFFVSVIDDSIRWMMCSIYKDKVLYGEVFGGSGDVYGSSFSKESLHILCCNDVIGKAAKAGMTILENEYGVTIENFEEVRDRLDKINCLSLSMKSVILPIASRVLEIPYKYLLTAPPKHVMLLGVLIYHASKGILDERFPILHEFLIGCPNNPDSTVSRSSYKIKNVGYVINDKQNKIFGLSSSTLKFNIMSCVCGILSVCKKDLVSILTGKKLPKINYSDLENDVIFFFSEMYSHRLDGTFARIRERADIHF